jgi:hypothetical protein
VEVIVDVWLEFAAGFDDFVDGISVFGCAFGGARGFAGDDEAHDIFGFDVLALGLETQSDLNGRHGVAVGVLLRVLAELRVDGVLAGWDGVLAHLLTELTEVVVDVLNDYFRVVTAEEKVQKRPVFVSISRK